MLDRKLAFSVAIGLECHLQTSRNAKVPLLMLKDYNGVQSTRNKSNGLEKAMAVQISLRSRKEHASQMAWPNGKKIKKDAIKEKKLADCEYMIK